MSRGMEPRLSAEVPLADQRRGVAVSLQHGRPGDGRVGQPQARRFFLPAQEIGDADLRAVQAREEGNPARRTDRRGDEGVEELRPFVGEAIDVGRPHLGVAVRAHGPACLIIGDDRDQVVALGLGAADRAADETRHDRDDPQQSEHHRNISGEVRPRGTDASTGRLSAHPGGNPSRARLQSRERPRARPELVGVDAQSLEHAHIEIAQRRRVVLVEGQMLAVLEAAAGQQDRQVLDGCACWRCPGCC